MQSKSAMSKRETDATSLVLLFILCLLAVTRLEITHWADNLGIAGWLLFIGVALGSIVGRTRINAALSGLIIFLFSVIIVPAIVLMSVSGEVPLDAKIAQLGQQISLAAAQLLSNQPVTDSILFILGMGLLYWVLGNAAGFTLTRSGRPWIPVLILGGAVILIEHYQVGARRPFYTWAYAVTSLVLLGRIYYLRIRDNLRSEEIKVGDEPGFDFTRIVIIAALILGLAGWVIPPVVNSIFQSSDSPTRLSQNWDRFSRNFEHLVFSLQETTPTAEENANSIMDLGTGQPLGVKEVLSIETNQAAPLNNSYYWRLRAYDIYSNSQWSTAPVYSRSFRPSQDLPAPVYKNLVPLRIRVTSSMSQLGMIFVPGIPEVISKQVEAAITTQGDSQADIPAIFTSPAIRNGESYRAEVELSSATRADLLTAGTDYPQWVSDRYLQLPSDFSPRVRNLSQELTSTQTTPFEKAAAVTSYLRREITYQTSITPPPAGRDAIDWFLFDYKKGFCNYYASAEVLLLRAAGVPARLAVGYAQGVQATTQNRYSVREKDSHAWPEVYFPGYGWIVFEPTGSISEIDYTGAGGAGRSQNGAGNATGSGAAPNAGIALNGEERAQRLSDSLDTGETVSGSASGGLSVFGKILLGIGIALGLALIVLLIMAFTKNGKAIRTGMSRHWQGLYHFLVRLPLIGDLFLSLSLTSAARHFLAIERGLRWLRVPLPAGSTAAELTDLLVTELPETASDARTLLLTYEDSAYGKKTHPLAKDRRAALRIHLAVLRVSLRRLFMPIRRLNDRFN